MSDILLKLRTPPEQLVEHLIAKTPQQSVNSGVPAVLLLKIMNGGETVVTVCKMKVSIGVIDRENGETLNRSSLTERTVCLSGLQYTEQKTQTVSRYLFEVMNGKTK